MIVGAITISAVTPHAAVEPHTVRQGLDALVRADGAPAAKHAEAVIDNTDPSRRP